MLQFFDTLTDLSGNALNGATVTVTTYPGGVAASIYATNGTSQPIANGVVTSDVTGQVSFYVPDGVYTLTYAYNGSNYKIRSPVQLIDPTGFISVADSSGAANTVVVTNSTVSAQKYVGLKLEILAANTNTGASTLNYQADGGFAINQPGGTSLAAGMIAKNGLFRVEWDGTQWELIGAQSQPFYAQTAAEIAASITPTSTQYIAGSILRYGADPTGTNDSTAAIQAAVNQWAQGGAPVYVPSGTYKQLTSVTLTATSTGRGAATVTNGTGFRMYGDGQGKSIITTPNNIENISTTGATSSNFLFQPQFENLSFINTYAATGSPQSGCNYHHIHLQNPLQARLKNVTLTGAFTDTVGLSTNHGGVWFDNQGYAAAYLNEVVDCWVNHAHVTCDTSDSIIRNCIIWGNGTDYAVKLNNANVLCCDHYDINGLTSTSGHGAVWLTTSASNCRVKGNFFDAQCTYGVWGDQQLSNYIQENIFWENQQAGIHVVNPSFWNICDNIFLNCGSNNAGLLCSDIILDTQSFCDFCTIMGNVHYRTASTTNAYGLYEYVNGVSATQNRIIGNVYADNGGSQYNTPAIKTAVTPFNSTPGSISMGNVGKGTETEVYQTATLTLTGTSNTVTATARISRQLNMVQIYIPSTEGTSTSTAAGFTGLPAAFYPANSQNCGGVPVVDNGSANFGGCCQVSSAGVMTLFKVDGSNFTTSGQKGCLAATINYSLT